MEVHGVIVEEDRIINVTDAKAGLRPRLLNLEYMAIKCFINGIALIRHIRKKYPEIKASFFLYIHPEHWSNYSLPALASLNLINAIFHFGSKESVKSHLGVFIDLYGLELKRDKAVNKYIKNLIFSESWFIRLFIILAILMILLIKVILPLERKYFNLPIIIGN